jgi:glycosyltransferase involved in cell wall biosynthesis
MVLPTRGEGFNLPAAEAMAAGVAVIVSEIGGHADFCTPQTARLIRCGVEPAQSHLAAPGALWAVPDEADLVSALREATAGPDYLRLVRAAVAVSEMTPERLVERVEAAVWSAM